MIPAGRSERRNNGSVRGAEQLAQATRSRDRRPRRYRSGYLRRARGDRGARWDRPDRRDRRARRVPAEPGPPRARRERLGAGPARLRAGRAPRRDPRGLDAAVRAGRRGRRQRPPPPPAAPRFPRAGLGDRPVAAMMPASAPMSPTRMSRPRWRGAAPGEDGPVPGSRVPDAVRAWLNRAASSLLMRPSCPRCGAGWYALAIPTAGSALAPCPASERRPTCVGGLIL